MNKSIVSINGKTFIGDNVSIVGNKIIVDGKEIDLNEVEDKEINITVKGNVNNLDMTSGQVTITGNVGRDIETVSADIEVFGDVGGDIETISGKVAVGGNVDGNIETVSGNIRN